MTVGTITNNSFRPPSGPWTGLKYTKTWSGIDRGQYVPYNPNVDHVIEYVGLGAGHAHEIFETLAREARESDIAAQRYASDQRHRDYLARLEQAAKRRDDALKRSLLYYASLRLKDELRRKEKEERIRAREHRVTRPRPRGPSSPKRTPSKPITLRLVDLPDGFEMIGYIPVKRSKIKLPARSNPKPPKRGITEDHPYTMSSTRLTDVLVTEPYSGGPPIAWQTLPAQASYGATTWTASNNTLSTNDQIKLVNRLTEEVRGTDFNLGVLLAEGNETLQLIGDTAIRLAKTLDHTLRGDYWGAARSLFEGTSRKPLAPRHPSWGQAARDVGEASGRLLELQYGVKPLLQDVHAGARALAHTLNYPFQQSYRAQVRAKEMRTTRTTTYTYDGAPNSVKTFLAKGYSVMSAKRQIIARIAEKDIPSLPEALGLLDPEVIVWEKIPFSFVADWFVPIGPYLEARAQAKRLRGKFITSNLQRGRAFTPVIQPNPVAPSLNYDGFSDVLFSRSISTTLKVPMPTYRGLKEVTAFQHCLNGLALIGSYAAGFSKVR